MYLYYESCYKSKIIENLKPLIFEFPKHINNQIILYNYNLSMVNNNINQIIITNHDTLNTMNKTK